MRTYLLAVLTIVACSPSNRDPGNGDAGSGSNHPGSDAGPGIDGSAVDTSQVYAHSGTTLYRVDTTTLEPVMIGAMTGLGTSSLTDLAIDKQNNMVGITLDKLFSIDPTTGDVTLVKALDASAKGFTSLSFVPSDLNDPQSADILVSANDQGEVYEIDPTTGDATMKGSYGSGTGGKIVSSGDLIGVRGLGIYATVDVGNGSGTNDFLAQIDPVSWQATPIGTGTGFNNIFGLGFWAGTIYGFVDDKTDHTGKIITIDPTTGVGTQVNTGAVEWFGAGVSTDAPIFQ